MAEREVRSIETDERDVRSRFSGLDSFRATARPAGRSGERWWRWPRCGGHSAIEPGQTPLGWPRTARGRILGFSGRWGARMRLAQLLGAPEREGRGRRPSVCSLHSQFWSILLLGCWGSCTWGPHSCPAHRVDSLCTGSACRLSNGRCRPERTHSPRVPAREGMRKYPSFVGGEADRSSRPKAALVYRQPALIRPRTTLPMLGSQ